MAAESLKLPGLQDEIVEVINIIMSRIVPQEWHLSALVPVPKKGYLSMQNNYIAIATNDRSMCGLVQYITQQIAQPSSPKQDLYPGFTPSNKPEWPTLIHYATCACIAMSDRGLVDKQVLPLSLTLRRPY